MSAEIGVRHTRCWTGGELLSGPADTTFTGVGIDTRSLSQGELFVAIRGPHHDAHGFLAQAVERGATGLLVNRGAVPAEALHALPAQVAVVAVDDTTAALGALATGHRRRFDGPLVAITGSNGKTTTKEMCAAILSRRHACLKTKGNLNNEYGLPLTLLRRTDAHQCAVVELGMNHRGEIARLARIAMPTVALVTNVGTAHIGNLGSREEIAREKTDLFAALGPEGTAVVNRDDPLVAARADRAPGRIVGFGHDPSADVRAESVRFLDRGAFAFELITPEGRRPIEIPGLAETVVINALAASAAALEAGAGLDDVQEALADFENVQGRMARRALPGPVMLIDDTYNANPQSMRAALETLSQLKGGGRGFAVLGDMGELGDGAERAHRDVGRWAAELGVDFLMAVGSRAEAMAEAATQAGLDPACVRSLADAGDEGDDAGRMLAALLRPRDWVLVKGSRAMRMERVVESVARQLGARDAQAAHAPGPRAPAGSDPRPENDSNEREAR
ncbi:MAG: UDP-N-acetylmuramoyl-tripeptide--D-alanyl-D-alanine ligase [Myxococcota bacterium]